MECSPFGSRGSRPGLGSPCQGPSPSSWLSSTSSTRPPEPSPSGGSLQRSSPAEAGLRSSCKRIGSHGAVHPGRYVERRTPHISPHRAGQPSLVAGNALPGYFLTASTTRKCPMNSLTTILRSHAATAVTTAQQGCDTGAHALTSAATSPRRSSRKLPRKARIRAGSPGAGLRSRRSPPGRGARPALAGPAAAAPRPGRRPR